MEKISLEIYDSRFISLLINFPVNFHGKLNNQLFILAHGSSNDMYHPLLEGVTKEYLSEGAVVVRFNFFFCEEGKVSRRIKEENRKTWISVFNYLKKRFPDKEITAGGKSLGSRVAAGLIVNDLIRPDRFIAFGYPLHSKTFFKKTNHMELVNINVSSLLFIGENDPLCRLNLFASFYMEMKNVEYLVIENGDHGLSDSGIYKRNIFDLIKEKTINWVSLSKG